jgi:hypothetical protein
MRPKPMQFSIFGPGIFGRGGLLRRSTLEQSNLKSVPVQIEQELHGTVPILASQDPNCSPLGIKVRQKSEMGAIFCGRLSALKHPVKLPLMPLSPMKPKERPAPRLPVTQNELGGMRHGLCLMVHFTSPANPCPRPLYSPVHVHLVLFSSLRLVWARLQAVSNKGCKNNPKMKRKSNPFADGTITAATMSERESFMMLVKDVERTRLTNQRGISGFVTVQWT